MTFLVADEKDKKQMDDLLKSFKAKVLNEVKWGKRKLAYPIRRLDSAYYFTYNLDIDPAVIQNLRTKINYNDKIIRYLLLKIEN